LRRWRNSTFGPCRHKNGLITVLCAEISAERLLRRVAVASPARRKDSNINKKALIAGRTLYLPIDIDGAVGDGNGAQGDSEVFITAIQ
jgi:acetamidase/formamidase